MPELPEIETIRRVIGHQIAGGRIENIRIMNPVVIAHPTSEEFRCKAEGRMLSSLDRRGKFLIFHLDDGKRILLHLRMTGCLLLTPPDYPEEKHTHMVFRLSNGLEMRYSDTRRFGRFWLLEKGEVDEISGVEKLGIEPFDPDFTSEYLSSRLGKRRKTIKECLLDQSAVAGIGNIYGDEILFASRINPSRSADTLRADEWERLAAAIPEVLSFFIERNTIAPEEYLKTKGREYRNTPFLKVYGHSGKPCPLCGTKLQRLVIGGRSSVYCPSCQK